MPIDGASSLKEALIQLQQDGVESVSVAGLIEFLKRAEPDGKVGDLSPVQLEHYKAQLSVWVEKQKEHSTLNVEGFKSVITAGQNALRSAILINGGAAVAILAYIGKLSVEAAGQVTHFALPLLLFVLGTLTVAVGSGITYLSQWFYFGGSPWEEKIGFGLNLAAIVLGFVSYIFFGVGTWWAYAAFKGYA
ncbi:hypothetical protein [Billgrantia desiderata]|uniref:hypothetical protein n=1 Tax=Billgrantia desiderata TaxID=52021 RepID=UPI003F3C1700